MPHLILEYTKNLTDKVNVPELLQSTHDALVGEGIDQARLKTRAIEITHSVVGTAPVNEGQMAHMTLLLLEGRSVELKQQYAHAVHDVVKEAVQSSHPNCAVTLEVRDMVKDTYIL